MALTKLSSPNADNETMVNVQTILVRNPATLEKIAELPVASSADVAAVVAHARQAQSLWRAKPFAERASLLYRFRDLLIDEQERLADVLTAESGKPRAEVYGNELFYICDVIGFWAKNAERFLKPQKIRPHLFMFKAKKVISAYHPLGVVGIISPWNFPLVLTAGDAIPALIAGNAVVMKPSELTPLTAQFVVALARKAGFPENLLQVVIGAAKTAETLVDQVDMIAFTGSVEVGKQVMRRSADRLIPVSLELGGKDPMVVLDDANIENAARGAVWGAFANSGQCCAAVERCYVHESIATQFIKAVVEETKRLRQGDPTTKNSDVGAMTSERQFRIVERHVYEATARGAVALTGGERVPNAPGPFFEPTVLTHVNHEMDVMREETFGPVLPIMTFKTDDEAVRFANDSIYGLTASVWTRDIARGKRLAERIDAGTVTVNEVLYTHAIAQTPWGGVKQSGFGRTHGRAGLMELVSHQHIHVNWISFMPDVWWFKYTPEAGRLFRGLARRFTSGSILQGALLLPQMIKRLFERRSQ